MGRKLAALRTEQGLSQRQLAERLTRMGEPASDKAVSKWEKGTTQPSARQFLALCRALEVADMSGEFLGEGLTRGLDRAGRRKLAEYADLLRRSGLYQPRPERGRAIRLYTLAASAGAGQFLDDGDFTWIDAAGAPAQADFAVRVAGDSMEPRYRDGQVVYVRAVPTVADGEAGLFYWQGSGYIKILRDRPEGVCLHSLNPAYGDIPVTDTTQLRVFGRVL